MDYTYQIRLRRGTSSQWSISNPILASGEPGLATDLNYYKIGDGVTPWNDLPWTTGLKGDSASVTAGETITGAPGSSADVTNSGTELNAIFDFVIPEGMPGKDLVVHEGDRDDPPSDWTNQQFLWDPNGEIHEEVPLTEAETDARYISKSLLTAKGDLMARDASTTVRVPVGQDGQLLTADSSALQGMAWKPNEAYSKAVSDARYEKKLLTQAVAWYDAGVLTDDGTALRDLSDNGRHAVFGAGAAAPVVLPYDGEPYVYYPQQTINGIAGLAGGGTPTSTVTAVLRRKWEWATGYPQQIFQVGAGVRYLLRVSAGGTQLISNWVGAPTASSGNKPVPTKEWIRITLNCATGEALCEQSDDGTLWVTLFTASHGKPPAFDSSFIYIGGGSATHSAPGRLYSARINFDGQDVAILDPRNVSADYTKIKNTGTAGGDWTIERAATGYKTAVVDRPLLLFGGGQTALAPASDVGPDEATLCVAFRAFGSATGVNDRFLFVGTPQGRTGATIEKPGGAAYVRALVGGSSIDFQAVYTPGDGQHVSAAWFGKSEVLFYDQNGLRAADRSIQRTEFLPLWLADEYFGTSNADCEFIAAAIFDRALTDAEVAQASAELLGTPMHEQADPLPQYILAPSTTVRRHGEWETAATWAALPSTGNWLGRRVKVLDGLGLCLAVWDGSKWIVDAQSDTGWHNLSHRLPAGVFRDVTICKIRRRQGDLVQYQFRGTIADADLAGDATNLFALPPSGATDGWGADSNPSLGKFGIPGYNLTTPDLHPNFGASANTLVLHRLNGAWPLHAIGFNLTWTTARPWPTTAP